LSRIHNNIHKININFKRKKREGGFGLVFLIPYNIDFKISDKDIVHPNKKGHALIAHAISKYVLKNLKQKQ
jgi:lysophospholipase L1-like esterase